MKTTLRGAKEMMDTIKRIATEFPERVAAALYVEAEIVMTESKRRCPRAPDGGTLRASGHVQPPVREGTNISVTLAYGGAASAYAIAVHEHLSEYSPYSWLVAEIAGEGVQWSVAGTGPKFLEGPINEVQDTMAERLASRLQLKGD